MPKEEAEAAAAGQQGLSGLFGIKSMMQRRQVTADMANESKESLQIKTQMVQILITRASADPSVANFFGNSASDIAKCLVHHQELLDLLK
jgi:hypothetical protein